MPENIVLDFSWGFLWKALALGVVTYFVWPLVFIFRSWAAQEIITLYIMKGSTHTRLNEYFLSSKLVYTLSSMLNAETPADLRGKIEQQIASLQQSLNDIERSVDNALNLISWIKQHFKLDGYESGIEFWMEACKRKGKMGMVRELPHEKYEELKNNTLSLPEFITFMEQDIKSSSDEFRAP